MFWKSFSRNKAVFRSGKTTAEDEFFTGLKAEEGKHLEAIENVFFYLERTGDWFASNEDRVWNWMNL